MIKTVSLTKTFGPTTALENLSTTIESGSIYGLVGSNGAGKSTLLHLLAGIYRPTSGSIEIDGQPVYENSACKQQIFFIPDEIYQQPGASMESMAKLYACLYTQWSQQRYEQLVQRFPIDPKRKLSTCSKGMRRQIAIILGMSCMPKYLLLDEAFDGLDPVIRVAVRKLISDDVIERGITVLIASHNLRELEDLCDQVGLLHGGHILFQRELDQLRCDFAKIQFAARPLPSREQLAQLFPIISMHSSGSIAEMVVRGNPIQIQQKLSVFHPLLCRAYLPAASSADLQGAVPVHSVGFLSFCPFSNHPVVHPSPGFSVLGCPVQLHFHHLLHGGSHLLEYHREHPLFRCPQWCRLGTSVYGHSFFRLPLWRSQ